ncbi:DNA-3-methyladenine glycosylase family protein [Microlunatus ginsengisoli]
MSTRDSAPGSGPTRTTSIEISGPYDLREVALMGFGHRDERSFDGVMRLAFCVDDSYQDQVGVEVRQRGSTLELTVHDRPGAEADLTMVSRQVARVLSVDADGAVWQRVVAADPVLRRLEGVAPGFRPALFYSPYEAAVWSIVSARRARPQGIALRGRLSAAHGAAFELAGVPTPALPTPSTLLALEAFPGLPQDRVPRLHAVAEATIRGRLDVARLRAMSPEEAKEDLQQLPGIGPFYSALVVVRALGLTDVLSTEESRSRAVIRELYGLDHDPSDAELAEIAEAWRPFRTWATVMLRAVGSRPEVADVA